LKNIEGDDGHITVEIPPDSLRKSREQEHLGESRRIYRDGLQGHLTGFTGHLTGFIGGLTGF
jgi:hypothetical protein